MHSGSICRCTASHSLLSVPVPTCGQAGAGFGKSIVGFSCLHPQASGVNLLCKNSSRRPPAGQLVGRLPGPAGTACSARHALPCPPCSIAAVRGTNAQGRQCHRQAQRAAATRKMSRGPEGGSNDDLSCSPRPNHQAVKLDVCYVVRLHPGGEGSDEGDQAALTCLGKWRCTTGRCPHHSGAGKVATLDASLGTYLSQLFECRSLDTHTLSRALMTMPSSLRRTIWRCMGERN